MKKIGAFPKKQVISYSSLEYAYKEIGKATLIPNNDVSPKK